MCNKEIRERLWLERQLNDELERKIRLLNLLVGAELNLVRLQALKAQQPEVNLLPKYRVMSNNISLD